MRQTNNTVSVALGTTFVAEANKPGSGRFLNLKDKADLQK
jgi:hypothetical protein